MTCSHEINAHTIALSHLQMYSTRISTVTKSKSIINKFTLINLFECEKYLTLVHSKLVKLLSITLFWKGLLVCLLNS